METAAVGSGTARGLEPLLNPATVELGHVHVGKTVTSEGSIAEISLIASGRRIDASRQVDVAAAVEQHSRNGIGLGIAASLYHC